MIWFYIAFSYLVLLGAYMADSGTHDNLPFVAVIIAPFTLPLLIGAKLMENTK